MATEPELTPVVDFLCEHNPSKSRVMALIGPYHGSRSLTGVLICKDKHHAYQAVQLLRRALAARDAAVVAEDLHALASALPDAPAGSLRTATAHAASGAWPAPASTTFCPPDENPGEDEETQGDEDSAASESGTPPGARLKDLPGKVVRITHLREFHIADEDALIRAAMDADWDPLPASELAEDGPRDLIGAVMTLAESGGWITGADTLEDQSEAELLRAEDGDELTDWSPDPVSAVPSGPRCAPRTARSPSSAHPSAMTSTLTRVTESQHRAPPVSTPYPAGLVPAPAEPIGATLSPAPLAPAPARGTPAPADAAVANGGRTPDPRRKVPEFLKPGPVRVRGVQRGGDRVPGLGPLGAQYLLGAA
jgi:hypothetical protein